MVQRHVASCYRISKQHFGPTIDLVCEAIIKNLEGTIPPLDRNEFISIANGFNEVWNFPNTVGAIK